MRNQGSQDAFARFDIQNLLGQYDSYWYSQFNKSAQVTPAMAYNRVSLVGLYELGQQYFIRDWLLTKVDLSNKSNLKTRIRPFESEDVFFYGSLVTYSIDPALPNNSPNATLQLKVDNGMGLIAPVNDVSNSGGVGSYIYGSMTGQDNLFNRFDPIDQGSSPVKQGLLLLDGIIFGIPKP